jgi:hypothetical protein
VKSVHNSIWQLIRDPYWTPQNGISALPINSFVLLHQKIQKSSYDILQKECVIHSASQVHLQMRKWFLTCFAYISIQTNRYLSLSAIEYQFRTHLNLPMWLKRTWKGSASFPKCLIILCGKESRCQNQFIQCNSDRTC